MWQSINNMWQSASTHEIRWSWNQVTSHCLMRKFWKKMQGIILKPIMDIFWEFLILYQMFFSPQIKRSVIISDKHVIYEWNGERLKRFTNPDLKISQYLCLHVKIICWRFHIKTPFMLEICAQEIMWKVCLQTFRNNRICVKNQPIFKEIYKLHKQITREFLRLRMRNFRGIAFT